jgi:hypothetical protein
MMVNSIFLYVRYWPIAAVGTVEIVLPHIKFYSSSTLWRFVYEG